MNKQKNIFLIALIGLCLSVSACTKKSDTIEKMKDAATDTLEKTKDAATEGLEKAKETTKEVAKKAEATINIKKKESKNVSGDNTWNIKLKTGIVKINLRPDLAPKHVERIKTLTKQGFYNGLKFHRVIEGFMAQTGDPKGNGTGGSSLPDLESEFTSTPFKRGVLGMARSASPHSANSQFFIMFDEGAFLNNKYTVFGEVTSGMEHVDALKKGNSAANGAVTDPDTMLEVTLGN